jgi:hypothetical protein
MSLEIGRLESIRREAHQFVVGILWLVALAVLVLDSSTVMQVAHFIDDVSVQMAHARVPDFVIGFFVVVLGIILPYCVAEAFIPFTTILMNISLRVYRRRNKHLIGTRLVSSASAAIRADTGIESPLTWHDRLLYLTVMLPRVADIINTSRRRIEFRAANVVPISVLFGAIAGRYVGTYLIDAAAIAIGAITAIGVFLIGGWSANRQLDSQSPNTDFAALLIARKALRSELYAAGTAIARE